MPLPNLYIATCMYLQIIVFIRITGWDMQYIHVRGHECLCVRARARVYISPWVYVGLYLYIAMDGPDIYR